MAKCRIDSFRLRGTGSMCHMFLLNVEFSNACWFRVFQSRISTISRFSFLRFQLPQCRHRRAEYWKLPAFLSHIQNVVTNFSWWQCLCTLLGPISLLYKQLLQYTLLKSFTVPPALLTKFSIRYHFHNIVHENTFSLTPPCFIWVSTAIAKHACIVLTVFCQCSSFVVNGITEIQQHIAGVQHNVNTSRKRRRRDADIRSAAAARRSVTIGGGGVSKMSAAAAAHSSTAGAPRFLCKRRNWCVCESWQRL